MPNKKRTAKTRGAPPKPSKLRPGTYPFYREAVAPYLTFKLPRRAKDASRADKELVKDAHAFLFGDAKQPGIFSTLRVPYRPSDTVRRKAGESSAAYKKRAAKKKKEAQRKLDKLQAELGQDYVGLKYAFLETDLDRDYKPIQPTVRHRKRAPDIVRLHGVDRIFVPFNKRELVKDNHAEVARTMEQIPESFQAYTIACGKSAYRFGDGAALDEDAVDFAVNDFMERYPNWRDWLNGVYAYDLPIAEGSRFLQRTFGPPRKRKWRTKAYKAVKAEAAKPKTKRKKH